MDRQAARQQGRGSEDRDQGPLYPCAPGAAVWLPMARTAGNGARHTPETGPGVGMRRRLAGRRRATA